MSLFLLIDGLNGGSTDVDHPGWFEIDSVQMGAGLGVSQGVASAPTFSEVTVTLSGLSPALVGQLALGTFIASIRVQEVDGSGAVAYDLLLGHVRVTGDSFGAGGGVPSTGLSFAYDLIALTTPSSSFAFDIPNDQPIELTAIHSPTPGGPDVLESGSVTQYTLLINDSTVAVNGDTKSWFEISSLQLGASAGVGVGDASSAPTFSELTVSLDGVSTDLLVDLAQGNSLSSIQIKGVNFEGELVYDLRLSDVLVSGHSIGSGGNTPSSSLSFAYERIGLITPTSSYGYDTVAEATIDANALPTLTAVGPDAVESGAVSRFLMSIDGLNGGSTLQGFKGWFELDSLQLGAGAPVADGVASLPHFSEVMVSLTGLSPELLDVLSTGTSLESVRIQGVTNLGTVLYDMRLAEVLLSGNSISAGGGTPSSSLSLHYDRIGLTTPEGSFGYDTVLQSSIDAATLPTPVPDGVRDLEAGSVTQYFLVIDGFNGGSTAANHKGWFEIDSLQLGAGVGIGSGGQVSAPSFSEVTVTMQGASPSLLGSLATGTAVDAVRVHGVNGLGEVVVDLRLAEVVLSGNSLSTGGGVPSASLSFAYDRIGLVTPTSSFGFDKAANVAIDPATLPAALPDAIDDLEDGAVTQYYLLVDGLNGGSVDEAFKGWFEIDSLQLGVGVGVGNGQVSDPYFSEVVVTLTGLSPALLGNLATQHVFDAVRVQGVNGDGAVVYDLRLGEVLLTGDSFSAGGDTPYSSLAFAYQRIGLVTPGSSFGYDLATQSSIDPMSIAPPAVFGPDVLESGSVSRFFLRVEGVEGGSTVEHHEGAFELTSLQLGAGLDTSGPLASPARFSELVVTMTGLSPALLAELATRSDIGSIQVEGVNFLGDVTYELRLGEVFLAGYSHSSGGGGAQASLSFTYERIGLITPSGNFGYDRVNDRAIDPTDIPLPGADVNEAPVVSLLTAGVGEDAPAFSQDLLTGASDPNPGTVLAIDNLDASVTTSGGRVLTVAAGDFTLAGSTLALTAAGLAQFNSLGAAQTDQAVFHFNVSDGALSTANTLQLTITGANDAAAISGTAVGAVTEDGGLTASGVLAVSDADAGQAQFAVPASLAGSYGTFSFNALTGEWGYTLNNALAAVQQLNAGQSLPDSLAVASLDGSATQTIEVTIQGVDEVNGYNPITGTDTADSLIGTAVADRINGLGGDDFIDGAAGNDAIDAGAGADIVNAGDGDDVIYARPGDGNDSYTGGTGNDTLVFETSAGATVNLATSNASSAQTGVDTLKSIENVWGGTGNDLIVGSAVANVLAGGDGDDTLVGGNGNDTLVGGEGDDALNGGKGDDLFVFAAGFGDDRISDFDANPKSGQDLLDLTAYGITPSTFGARVAISDIGADTLVMIDGLDSIVLVGLGNAATVTAQDFML